MGGYWYVDSQPYSAVLDALIAASNSSQIVLTTGTYSDPGFIASLAASKITGTLAKSQQHAQTAYKDEANTWAQAQTFNGAIGFKEDVWSISNADSARRLFFQNNSTTYIAGNGSNPVQLRNGSEQPLVSFNSNFETIFHSTGGGFSGSIYAGSATFTGPTQINGAAGGASTYLQLLNNGSAIAILGSDTSISGGNAADVGLFVHGDNELCLWVNSTRMVRVSDSGSTFNGASTFTGNISAASGLAVSGKIQISNNGSGFGSPLSNGSSQFYNSSTAGLIIAGAGSTSDVLVTNKSGGDVFSIPTGTTNVNFAGSVSTGGGLTVNSVTKLGDYTVATLPSAAAYAGYEANVTDSSVTTFGSTVAGGGSSRVKVYSNGTNWTVQAA